MNVLVLTDHGGHTANNSVYALAHALRKDGRVAEVRVASRASPQHAAFFECTHATPLSAARVDDDFAFDAAGASFADGRLLPTPLDWPDAVLLRIPHPVPAAWFGFLRGAFGETPIVNAPEGIAATTTKAWLLNVRDLCPDLALCGTPDEVTAFAQRHDGASVLKPLEGYGGRGVLRVLDGRVEVDGEPVALGAWAQHPLARHPYLAMEYLPRVSEGDKRIVVVDGEVIGAVLRIPRAGTWLANVSQGGRAEASALTPAEQRIVDALHPHMRDLGVVMYGIDTLVGNVGERVLSEVNTMSIGGLLDLPSVGGRSAAERAAGGILRGVGVRRRLRA